MLEYIGYSKVLDIVGGKKYGSVILANIIYNMDTFNVDISNLRTIDNAGSEGATADGLMYGSNHIYLGATQSVSYPIPYTLGSENYTGVITVAGVITKTDLTGGNWNIASTGTTSTNDYVEWEDYVGTSTGYFILEFDATINSGSLVFDQIYVGGVRTALTPNYTVVNGHNSLIVRQSGLSNRGFILVSKLSQVFNIDINNSTVKELTNPNSALIYYDVATKAHILIDNSTVTPSTIKSMTTSHSNLVTLNVVPTAGDITALNANPEDISRIVNSVTPIGTYSFGLADIEAFYPGNEGEALHSESYNGSTPQPYGNMAIFDGKSTVTTYTLSPSGTEWVNNGDGSYTITSATAAHNLNLFPTPSTATSGDTVTILSFTIVKSGTGTSFSSTFTAAGYVSFTSSGTYSFVTGINGTGANIKAVTGETITVSNISLRTMKAKTITNYTSTSRTTYKNTNYGASSLLYTQDATGRLTGMVGANLTEFNLDGRYVSTGWTPSDASDFKIHVVANITSGTSSTPSTLIGGGRTRMYYRGDVNRVYAYFFNISVQDNSPITNALVMYSMEYVASSKTITLYKNSVLVSTLSGITPSPLPYSMFLGAKNLAGATEFFDGTIGKVIIDTNDTYTIEEAYALAKTTYPTLP